MTAAEPLERRYRRLLGCYPRRHRAEYGEEMLGVLLSDAGDRDGPGRRRWPAPGDVADLLAGAGRAWLRWGAERAAGTRWAGAAAVLAVALPFAMVLASLPTYWTIIQNWPVYLHQWKPFVDPQAMLAGWVVVFALSFTRLRRLTAAAAWLCTLPQLLFAALLVLPALPALSGVGSHLCWPLLATLTATALTFHALHEPTPARPPGARSAPALLGPAATVLLLATAVEFVVVQPVTDVVDPRALDAAVWSIGGVGAWWGLAAAGTAVPLAAAVLVARRLDLPAALRALGAVAGIAMLFLGGGRLADLLLSINASLPVYGVGRWIAVPLLAFAAPVLAARLVERRAATAGPTEPPIEADRLAERGGATPSPRSPADGADDRTGCG